MPVDIGAAFALAIRRAGEDIVYQKGDRYRSLKAFVGRGRFAVEEVDGTRVTWETAEFVVAREDLPLESSEEPTRGDIIQWRGRTYEVASPPGQPEVEELDPGGKVLRIRAAVKP